MVFCICVYTASLIREHHGLKQSCNQHYVQHALHITYGPTMYYEKKINIYWLLLSFLLTSNPISFLHTRNKSNRKLGLVYNLKS